MTPRCSRAAIQLYKIFVHGECVITNSRTAEMCKLTENSFRDVNIAFANELSIICDKLDIDTWELIRLANRHPRVNILQPGPGVGGHCIAVDPWFIVSQLPDQARLIRCAREVNDSKPTWVVDKVKNAMSNFIAKNPKQSFDSLTVSFLGLTFKADIDDTRESPAVDIVRTFSRQHQCTVLVAEPHLVRLPNSLIDERITLVAVDEAIKCADVVVMLVDHQIFKQIDPLAIAGCELVDTRGVW
jgi:UDP-N-acetyl-D-mannosaminuronic acid dehydrogenase